MEESIFNYSESRKAPYLRFPPIGGLLVLSAESPIFVLSRESPNSLSADGGAASHVLAEKPAEGWAHS